MSAKSMRTARAQALRVVAMTAMTVIAWTLLAAPETAVAEVQTETEGPANLAVEIQLSVNDGPLIDPRDIAAVQAGDSLAYTYRVTNTGEAVVSSPVVETVDFTGSGELGAMFCHRLPRTLAPETAFACGRTYVVSEDDASTGDLVHTVVASGTLTGEDVATAGDTGPATAVVSSPASVGAQVTSGDRELVWKFFLPVAALTTVLLAVAWYIRRRRGGPVTTPTSPTPKEQADARRAGTAAAATLLPDLAPGPYQSPAEWAHALPRQERDAIRASRAVLALRGPDQAGADADMLLARYVVDEARESEDDARRDVEASPTDNGLISRPAHDWKDA